MKQIVIATLVLLSLVSCKKSPKFVDYFPDTGVSFAGHMLGHEFEVVYNKDGFLIHGGIRYKLKSRTFIPNWLEFDLSETNSALVRSGLTKGIISYVIEAKQQYELALQDEACGENVQCSRKINQDIKNSGTPLKIIPYGISASGIMNGDVSSIAIKFIEKMRGHGIYFKKIDLHKYDDNEMVRYAYETNGLYYGMSVSPEKDKPYKVKVILGMGYQPAENSEDARSEKHRLQIRKAVDEAMSKSHRTL